MKYKILIVDDETDIVKMLERDVYKRQHIWIQR